jgi:hypothetical protein
MTTSSHGKVKPIYVTRRLTPNLKRGTTMNRLQRITSITVLALAATVTAAFAQSSTPVQTGVFHGQVHSTSGRASIYKGSDGKLTLRLTNFKTSNGPDVHVLLIAASDAQDNDNFLKNNVERVELGKLKGNEGDQNYDIPADTDITKFHTVAIYCERFNANFGTAPLEKF